MDLSYRSEKGQPALNEDACLADAAAGVFAVCDGLGGNICGDKAAKKAIEVVSDSVRKYERVIQSARDEGKKEDRRQVEQAIDLALQVASRIIYQEAGSDPKQHGMCTTVDMLLFLGTHALIAHVGSGRVYLMRNGELHQLTEDHTLLAHLRRTGKIDSVPANQQAQQAKRLTRAVGFQEQVKVDLLEVELQPGDRFLLLSDGVWFSLGDDSLENICSGPRTAEELLNALHAEVEKRGAKDNYTTVAVEAPVPKVAAAEGSAEQKIKMLGRVAAFEYLSYQELIRVINSGELLKVPQGKLVCKEGDPGGEMMLILTGSVEITKNGQLMRLLGKGDVFGEMSMIDAAPRSASIVAKENTNLLAFPREALCNLFREEPSLAVKFLWGVTMETNKRMRMLSNRIVGRPEREGVDAVAPPQLPFLRTR